MPSGPRPIMTYEFAVAILYMALLLSKSLTVDHSKADIADL